MLKKYRQRDDVTMQLCVSSVSCDDFEIVEVAYDLFEVDFTATNLYNSEILNTLDTFLSHLDPDQFNDASLIRRNQTIFSDSMARTNLAVHNIGADDSLPVK